MTNVYRCPVCEFPRDAWPDDSTGGYVDDDEVVYCCKGCATGTGCTCTRLFTQEGRPAIEQPELAEHPHTIEREAPVAAE